MTSFDPLVLEIDQSPAVVIEATRLIGSLQGNTRRATEDLLLRAGNVETRGGTHLPSSAPHTPNWSLTNGRLVRVVGAHERKRLAREYGVSEAQAAWSCVTRFVDTLSRTG